MNKNKTLMIAIIVFALLLGGAYALYQKLSQGIDPDMLTIKDNGAVTEEGGQDESGKVAAPDFTVYDADGNEVQLSDFFGKPIVVNFWASWCGPCMSEMPDFDEANDELGESVQFLMINMTDGARETVESASSYVKSQEFSFPVYYDTASNAAMTYSVYSLPTTFFIDGDGYAVAQATGAIDQESLQRGIDMIL